MDEVRFNEDVVMELAFAMEAAQEPADAAATRLHQAVGPIATGDRALDGQTVSTIGEVGNVIDMAGEVLQLSALLLDAHVEAMRTANENGRAAARRLLESIDDGTGEGIDDDPPAALGTS